MQALQTAEPQLQTLTRTAESIPSTTGLDQLADGITKAVADALQASTKRSTGRGTGQPWWNEACQRAAQVHRQARSRSNEDEETGAKRDLRRVVRKTKRDYWREKINNATESKDIFQMVGWGHSAGNFHSPPLTDPESGATCVLPNEKRELLARTLLQKAACQEDIPTGLAEDETPLPARLPFPPATRHEVEDSVLRAKSTTPGADEVSTDALRLAWPHLREAIYVLYSKCLDIGWHPLPFRTAMLVAIPKAGKKDKSSPRSYRLIALLSVLGKGLERLVARRLAWTAIREKVLHPQHFGALPRRSATDLAAAVIHDIEEARIRGKVTSMLTLDVKGAFDAVLPGRLAQRLRQQSWPENLVRWTRSFATQRTATLQLDKEQGATFKIPAGLPQGSPVSPILFMLFLQPLFYLGSLERKRARSGYADDICLLAASNSLEENNKVLAEDFREITQWAHREGLTFDIAKTELIHFTSRTRDRNPAISLQLTGETHNIEPTPQDRALRWLGIFFDRKLSFKAHASILAARDTRTANGIRALGNTVRGAAPGLLRQAVQACVLPVLYYGSEAWL